MADQYSIMLADASRIEDFNNAIQKAVQPGDVVVDLGCGVGTFAMQAAKAGARRVFGVEIDPIVHVAAKIAKLNNIDVEFIEGDARNVQLPEPATLLIFEDYNTGLIDGIGAKLLEVARENWVAENYRVLPQGATLNLAPVSSDSVHKTQYPLGVENHTAYGFDFTPLIELARNTMSQLKGTPDVKVLAPPAVVLSHDFMKPLPTRWSTDVKFEIDQSRLLDGVCLWHDFQLDDDIGYSNHPNHPDNAVLWGQYFFPTPDRWRVKPGDTLHVSLSFQDALDDGFWKWKIELSQAGEESTNSFSGNTFASSSITAESLQKSEVG